MDDKQTNSNTTAEEFEDLYDLLQALAPSDDATAAISMVGGDSADMRVAGGNDILDDLEEIENGPKGSTDNKKAPPAPSITILPYDKEAAKENYGILMEANSIVQLYTAAFSQRKRKEAGHPNPYDITDPKEAALAFREQASSAYTVMSEALAGYFNYSSGSGGGMHQTIKKAEIHLKFLEELFKGFSLGEKAKAQLDSVLTKFVEAVSNISVEAKNTNNTVDQSLRIIQCAKVNISGDDSDPEWIYQPRVKIVYMHIDASTWKWATNKAQLSSSEFNMQYSVADFDLNVNKFKGNLKKLEQVWKKVSNKSLREWSEKTTGPPLQEDK